MGQRKRLPNESDSRMASLCLIVTFKRNNNVYNVWQKIKNGSVLAG